MHNQVIMETQIENVVAHNGIESEHSPTLDSFVDSIWLHLHAPYSSSTSLHSKGAGLSWVQSDMLKIIPAVGKLTRTGLHRPAHSSMSRGIPISKLFQVSRKCPAS